MSEPATVLNSIPPNAEYPLRGQTILLVEDSRFACEAMRLMSQRSGARLRRADTLEHARQHLRTYRPGVVIVDLGLPDGCGETLIADLARATPRVDVLIGTSGDPDGDIRARIAGADGFLPKPVESLGAFQSMILSHLPANPAPDHLRHVRNDVIAPDPLAYRDDLAHAAEVMASDYDRVAIRYLTQFLGGVAHSADDLSLGEAVDALARSHHAGNDIEAKLADLSGLVKNRLEAKDWLRDQ